MSNTNAMSVCRDSGGALLVAVENSTHDTFSDLPVLFATRFSWALSRVRGLLFDEDWAANIAVIRHKQLNLTSMRLLSGTSMYLLWCRMHICSADSVSTNTAGVPVHGGLTNLTCCSSQLGFDTKLDPVLGMAAVASTVALFLHLHLPTSAPPLLPEELRRGAATGGLQQQGGAAAADKQQPPGQQNGAAPEAGMQHSDSGWSLVSAGDAGNGAHAGSQNNKPGNGTGPGTDSTDGIGPEGPSEATRTDAAVAQRTLDPAAGAEGQAGGGERGSVQTVARPPQGGAFLPSAAELRSISSNARPSQGKGAMTDSRGGGDAGAAQMRRAAGEASKVAVSDRTRQAVAQLLGQLAAVLELHAPAGIDGA